MIMLIGILGSILGLGVSAHLYQKKLAHTKLVCPLRTRCDQVLHSRYATSLGIPNELLGMIYYTFAYVLYVVLLSYHGMYAPLVLLALAILSLLGLTMSMYLLSLQAFIIRAWCMWCLLSALATVCIALGVSGAAGVALAGF